MPPVAVLMTMGNSPSHQELPLRAVGDDEVRLRQNLEPSLVVKGSHEHGEILQPRLGDEGVQLVA